MDLENRIPDGLQQYVNEMQEYFGRRMTQAEKEKVNRVLEYLQELKAEREYVVAGEIVLRDNSLRLLLRLQNYETYGPSSEEIPTLFDAEVSEEMRKNLICSVKSIRRIMKILHDIEPRWPKSWPNVEQGLKKLLKKVKQLEAAVKDCWDSLAPDETLDE